MKKNSEYALVKKWGDHEIVIAVREEPLANTLSQKQKEARIVALMHKYGVRLN